MDQKTEICGILQRICGMKNDLYDMEKKLLKLGGFDWKEMSSFNKVAAIKMYKEKFGVDLRTAKDQVEKFIEICVLP